MGRRKTKKIKPSKSSLALRNRRKLDKEFHCHFCQHDRSVSIRIDMRSAIGFLSCRICGVNFSTRITSLDEPIDVYTIWMDKCRETDNVMTTREDTKNHKKEDKNLTDDSNERTPDQYSNQKKLRDESDNKYDNLNVDETDDVNNEDFNLNTHDYVGKGSESVHSDKEAQSPTNPSGDLSSQEQNVDDKFLNINRNKVSGRIIVGDEPYNEFKHFENPDTRVHDLFQDDE